MKGGIKAIATLFSNRGNAYRKLGQLDKAVEDLSKALELEPQEVPMLSTRAGIYEAQGEYEKAVADCKKALDLDPDKKNAKEILARCEAALKERKR